jgi:hypothetical protein
MRSLFIAIFTVISTVANAADWQFPVEDNLALESESNVVFFPGSSFGEVGTMDDTTVGATRTKDNTLCAVKVVREPSTVGESQKTINEKTLPETAAGLQQQMNTPIKLYVLTSKNVDYRIMALERFEKQDWGRLFSSTIIAMIPGFTVVSHCATPEKDMTKNTKASLLKQVSQQVIFLPKK